MVMKNWKVISSRAMKIRMSTSERKLARLDALVVAEGERDEARREARGSRPRPAECPSFSHVHPDAGQTRHDVVAESDEQGREHPEDDAVDVDRPQAPEGEVRAGAEEVRVGELRRDDHPDRGREHDPEEAPVEPEANDRVTCHGGAGPDPSIPALHSLPSARLIAALRAYRAGARANPVMQSVARALDDAAIEALAAYFSGQ